MRLYKSITFYTEFLYLIVHSFYGRWITMKNCAEKSQVLNIFFVWETIKVDHIYKLNFVLCARTCNAALCIIKNAWNVKHVLLNRGMLQHIHIPECVKLTNQWLTLIDSRLKFTEIILFISLVILTLIAVASFPFDTIKTNNLC